MRISDWSSDVCSSDLRAMSRKGNTPQRSVLPDPKHGSETIARFINMVMYSGKKSVAEKIVYGAMDVIGEKNPNPHDVVEKALGKISTSSSNERRVGTGGVRKGSFGWRPVN